MKCSQHSLTNDTSSSSLGSASCASRRFTTNEDLPAPAAGLLSWLYNGTAFIIMQCTLLHERFFWTPNPFVSRRTICGTAQENGGTGARPSLTHENRRPPFNPAARPFLPLPSPPSSHLHLPLPLLPSCPDLAGGSSGLGDRERRAHGGELGGGRRRRWQWRHRSPSVWIRRRRSRGDGWIMVRVLVFSLFLIFYFTVRRASTKKSRFS